MITSRKSEWFGRVFAAYNRNLLARRFEGLRAAGLEGLRAGGRDAGLLLYANHSSWWDGLAAFQLGRACGLDQYVMMEERQLRARPLFRRLGAFSVERERPRAAARSVAYAAGLLRAGPRRAVWIFPQGATLPNDARPLRFYTGAARVVERARVAYAAPVAFRYEFLEDFRPEAFARVGPPERLEGGANFDARVMTERLSETLTRTLDRLREDILHARLDGYEELVAPRRRRARSGSESRPPGG